ncbi:glycosyltransferase [Streptomyces sp. NPDC005438]|uniref:glycosyltransferase n=1 Tax=Streptomyces sp. NPDC005438 TaxID=3156880 RepID=UPI0033B4DC60
MSRFLLVVPPLVGHINPLVGVAGELTRRGHQVAWCGRADWIHQRVGAEARVYDCAIPEEEGIVRPAGLTGPAAFRFLWEEFFVPLAETMAPGVERAVRDWRPDVVLSDQHTVAGSLVAERLGVPHMTSASTCAELIDPLAELPKVAAWLDERLDALRRDLGDPSATNDPRFSRYGTLAFTGRELLAGVEPRWDHVHLLGPVLGDRPDQDDFPWDRLDENRELVFVSLGTANTDAGARFLQETGQALALLGDRVQGVVSDPGGHLTDPPPGTVVRPHVPQLAVLERAHAVISHGGHNTVCESLWHGLPLLLAPIRDDQPLVSRQVVEAGAGVRVRFGRVRAERLAEVLRTLLDDTEGHRTAAATIGRSLRQTGGQHTAADHLERLAERGAVTTAAR